MSDILPNRSYPPARLDDAAGVMAHYAGTYATGLSGLKNAATSSLRWAAIATERLLSRLTTIQKKSRTRGEVALVISTNYDLSLSGPSLSATLFPVFAAEAFLKLGFQIALERKRPRGKRAAGYDEVLISKLGRFDESSLGKKLDQLASALGVPTIPSADPRRAAIDDVVAFRNMTVHESPTLVTGRLEYLRHTRRRAVEPADVTSYPDLATNLRPIRLKHALRSVKTHDEIVTHVYSHADAEFTMLVKELDARSRGFATLRQMYGSPDEWRTLQQLSRRWESAGETAATCTVDEMADAIADFGRSKHVRLVE